MKVIYRPMLARGSVLREQYGRKGVIPLLEMMWRAATNLYKPKAIAQSTEPTPAPDSAPMGAGQTPEMAPGGGAAASPDAHQNPGAGAPGTDPMDGNLQSQRATIMRQTVSLPARYEPDVTGKMQRIERQLGEGGNITLKWPPYFEPSVADVQAAATAATAALQGGLITDEEACGYIAPFFKVEDVAGLVSKVRDAASQQQADLYSQFGMANPQDDSGFPPQDDGSGEPQ
jgi:hypothetical protein